jgi:6,7-dimethyl-8-ribityllumazine synthase
MVIEEVWVPGSMEKPLALKRMLQRPDIDAAVALGVIEQGETSHGIVMAHAVLNAIIALQLELMKPIGVGILGPEISPQQMDARVIPYSRSAVLAVRHMLGYHGLESISTDSSG